jgi:hypothetical protein
VDLSQAPLTRLTPLALVDPQLAPILPVTLPDTLVIEDDADTGQEASVSALDDAEDAPIADAVLLPGPIVDPSSIGSESRRK